jgi:hypothetical protein
MTKVTAPRKGCIYVRDGVLKVPGIPPYSLPESIDPTFVKLLFAAPPGDEHFIGELASGFLQPERSRLFHACRNLGGDSWETYRTNAMKWAWLVSDSGTWDISGLRMVYMAEVNAPKLIKLAICDRNIRFVDTPLGWMTFPEFKWKFGEDVVTHIEAFAAATDAKHNELMRHLQEIALSAKSEMIVKEAVVVTPQGVQTMPIAGLANIPTKNWTLPAGYSFLEEVNATEEFF